MESQITIGKACLKDCHRAVFDQVKQEFSMWDESVVKFYNTDEGLCIMYEEKTIGYFETTLGWVNSITWFVKVQFIPSPHFWTLKYRYNEDNKKSTTDLSRPG